jgi:hypothetical protein
LGNAVVPAQIYPIFAAIQRSTTAMTGETRYERTGTDRAKHPHRPAGVRRRTAGNSGSG